MSIREVLESFPNEDERIDQREFCSNCGRIQESKDSKCIVCGSVVGRKETLLDKIEENKEIMEFGEKYPNHPKIIDFLEDKWDEFTDANDAVNQVGKVFGVSEEDAKKVVAIVGEEIGQIVSVEDEIYASRHREI